MEEGAIRISVFGGLDQSKDEALIEKGFSPDAHDMDCTGGILRQAAGHSRHIQKPVPGGVVSLLPFYPRSAAAQLLAASRQALYLWNGEDWLLIKDGFSHGRFNHVSYQIEDDDVLLLAGGEDGAYVWDGETLTEIEGEGANIAHLCLHVERVWGAGKPGEPDTVRWARPYRAMDWSPDPENPETGGGFVLTPTWNGGRVRALRTLYGDVVVFKDEDIFRIYGTYPGNYEVVRVHGVVGPIAERSIVAAGDRCYFLSSEGLCVYDGVRAVQAGGSRAKEFLSSMSRAWAHLSCAAEHQGVVYLAVPVEGSCVNNAVLTLDLNEGIVMVRRNLQVSAMLSWQGNLLFAGDDGVVYSLGGANDGAQAMYLTPWMDLGRADEFKYIREVVVQGTGEGLISLETEKHSRLLPFHLGAEELVMRLRSPMRAKRFRLRFSGAQGGNLALRAGVTVKFAGSD